MVGELQGLLRLQLGDRGLRALHFRAGLREPRVVVARVEPDQHLVRMDELVVVHQHVRDEAVHLRRHHGHIAAHVRIVGRFDEAADEEPVRRRERQHDEHRDDREQHPRNAPCRFGGMRRARRGDSRRCSGHDVDMCVCTRYVKKNGA